MNVPYIDLSREHAPLKQEFLDAFARVIDHGGYCLGPEVDAFEKEFAAALSYPRVVGVGSGTEALHLAALGMDVGPGDEVIVPAFSFIASAWFGHYTGARVVFAEVDRNSYTLDPSRIEELITDKTKAIVVTHIYGQPADMDPILAVAQKHGLKVVEDAAQAHMARYKGTPVGLCGDAGIISFYPSKNLGALGEGGCVVARDEALLDKVTMLRAHGMRQRYFADMVGYNNRMEGLQAASLRVKLPQLEARTKRRQAIAQRYLDGISQADAILPAQMDYGQCVYHVFTLRHPERDRFREYLAEKGVGTDVVYPLPLHLQPCFAFLGYEQGAFPVAEEITSTCFSLPIFPDLNDEEVDYVIETVNAFA